MDNFSQLIAQGVANFEYKTITGSITPTYSQDLESRMIRDYNNLYSIATNTHMSKTADGKIIITGTLVGDKKYFDRFLYSTCYKNLMFNMSVCTFIYNNGYIGHYDIYNNDDVYMLELRTMHPELFDKIGSPCQACQDCCVCTSESQIPQNIKYISKTANIETVKECFSQEDAIKALNEHQDIKGNNWIMIGLSDGYHLMEMDNKLIIK